MAQIPTVKIKMPANKRAGYAIINESDFDPKKHELFDAPDEPAGDKPLEEMTRKELDALAAERGVDVSDARNKGDVIAALELAAEAGA